jgi:hypothetical protein
MADLPNSHMRSCNERIDDDFVAHDRHKAVLTASGHSFHFATITCTELNIRIRPSHVCSLA